MLPVISASAFLPSGGVTLCLASLELTTVLATSGAGTEEHPQRGRGTDWGFFSLWSSSPEVAPLGSWASS